MSQKAITVLVFLIVALLILVVVVGLFQGLLEITGVATTLCAVLTGIVGGSLYRSGREKNGGDDK